MQALKRPHPLKVYGHRGGFKPENTLLAFKQARHHNLFGVELDVWITKDHQLAVVHGGLDGELPLRSELENHQLIYEMTLEQARKYFTETPCYKQSISHLSQDSVDPATVNIPTLAQVFDVLGDDVQVNIEIKTPQQALFYDRWLPLQNTTVKLLHDLLAVKGRNAIVSSFDHEFLRHLREYQTEAVSVVSSENHSVISLRNQMINGDETVSDISETVNPELTRLLYLSGKVFGDMTYDKLPGPEVTDQWDLGVNILSRLLNQQVVEHFHRNGQIVGVWFHTKLNNEGPELWDAVNSLGVDMFCTDNPLELMEHLNKLNDAQC